MCSLCHIHLQGVIEEVQQKVKDKEQDDNNKVDPSLVQIKADKAEIERRIAAFIQKKQMQVNDTNRREFCGVMREEPGMAQSLFRAVLSPVLFYSQLVIHVPEQILCSPHDLEQRVTSKVI